MTTYLDLHRDLLAELASVHELPLPVSDGPSLKRGREDPNDAGVNGASGGASHPDFSHVSMDPLPQPPLHNPPDYQALSAMPTSNRPLPYSQHMNGDVPAYQPHEVVSPAAFASCLLTALRSYKAALPCTPLEFLKVVLTAPRSRSGTCPTNRHRRACLTAWTRSRCGGVRQVNSSALPRTFSS